jgi:Bacterial SH3 domain
LLAKFDFFASDICVVIKNIMKKCPTCKNTYTDDSLAFCLSDGTVLVQNQDEEITQQISALNNPIRVNIAQDSSPTTFTPAIQPTQSKSGKGWIIGLLVGLFLLVTVGIAGVAGFYFLNNNAAKPNAVVENKAENKNTSPTPMGGNSNTANLAIPTPNENEAMKQKLAELEKKLKDQKGKIPTVPTLPNSPNVPKVPTVTTAKVNSPGDGFLALRTGPSSETGERIMEIPHGATVTVLACQAAVKGRKGKWCKVNYNGNAGWAFDGFMIY